MASDKATAAKKKAKSSSKSKTGKSAKATGSKSKKANASVKQAPKAVTENAKPGEEAKESSAEAIASDSTTKHTLWDDLRHSIPPWLDEIIGITLVIFGILSFLALFDTSGAVVAVAWSGMVSSLFGYGSLLVSLGLFILGMMILLPKVGITVRLTQAQILGTELLFLCILGILHLLNGNTDFRTIARDGEGGGLIGWGLSLPFYLVFDREISLVILGILLVISLAVATGLRRTHVSTALEQMSNALENLRNRIPAPSEEPLTPNFAESGTVNTESAAETSVDLTTRRLPLMRIRPNPRNLPPSLRPQTKPTENPRHIDLRQQDADPEDPALADHPLFTGERLENTVRDNFNAIGELTGEKDRDGIPQVKRPDGRIKRYFPSKHRQDDKKIGRRLKVLPPLNLLSEREMMLPNEQEINQNVVLIENTLLEFDIDIDVVDVQVGPTVTRYAIQPYRLTSDGREIIDRTRIRKILSYTNDIALSLSAKRLRIEAPVPGKNYMGVEVPNKKAGIVSLRSVIESRTYYDEDRKTKSPLVVPLGRDVAGEPVVIDLAKMPHLLIAGTTGSGKSVSITSMATSLILNNPPERVKMIMIDPKMVELRRFNGIPHLLGPVETDAERSIGVLKWCTDEMDRRYKLLEEHTARNIEAFNLKKGKKDYLPYILIVIDEIGDLMSNAPEETERALTRLAQMARAVGMHLVVATQRPSVDVITGLIKANFPSRVSFSVASSVDSRVIIDTVGAENLLGNGDMLYQSSEAAGPQRIQGCFVADEEVNAILQHWKDWYAEKPQSRKNKQKVAPWEKSLRRNRFLTDTDPMIEDAIRVVVEEQEASASMLQRRLELGYPRAARIIDLLEELGVIGESMGGGRSREVLIEQSDEDPVKQVMELRRAAQNESAS